MTGKLTSTKHHLDLGDPCGVIGKAWVGMVSVLTGFQSTTPTLSLMRHYITTIINTITVL